MIGMPYLPRSKAPSRSCLTDSPPKTGTGSYKMLSLKVEAIPGGPLKLTGAFTGGLSVGISESRSSRDPHTRAHRRRLHSLRRHSLRDGRGYDRGRREHYRV